MRSPKAHLVRAPGSTVSRAGGVVVPDPTSARRVEGGSDGRHGTAAHALHRCRRGDHPVTVLSLGMGLRARRLVAAFRQGRLLAATALINLLVVPAAAWLLS